MSPSDCPVFDGGGPFCTDPGFSCVNQRCVKECGPSRTCTADLDAGCLTCDGGTTCISGSCAGLTMTGHVERATCATWPDDGTTMLQSQVTVSGVCLSTLTHQNGGVIGRVMELRDGTFLGDLPGFGGPCTATRLPTGVERWAFACPACQFVIAWF